MLADAIGYDERMAASSLAPESGATVDDWPMTSVSSRYVPMSQRAASQSCSCDTRREPGCTAATVPCSGSVSEMSVTALGAALKPHGDGIRHWRALDVVVRSAALASPQAVHTLLNYVESRGEALCDADATEWNEDRREPSPEYAARSTAGRVVVDGRNCLDTVAWRAAGHLRRHRAFVVPSSRC